MSASPSIHPILRPRPGRPRAEPHAQEKKTQRQMHTASLARSAARLGRAACASRKTSGPIASMSSDGAPSRRALLAGGALLIGSGVGGAGSGARPALAAPRAGPRLDVDAILAGISFPAEPPFEPDDFRRYDESDDAFFYESPRFGECLCLCLCLCFEGCRNLARCHPFFHPIPLHTLSRPPLSSPLLPTCLSHPQSPTSTTRPSAPTRPSSPPTSSRPPGQTRQSLTCAPPGSLTTRLPTLPPGSRAWA
jgi:hypothetical protein